MASMLPKTPEKLMSEVDFAITLIGTRQTILPKHLHDPGPSEIQLDQLFKAAAAAPDHGCLRPWRFITVPTQRRARLADVFARSLRQRDPDASEAQIEQAREKAFRSPFLALVVARLGPSEPAIDPLERMVSVGAAVQNMLLCAHAMGFATSLTGGQALREEPVRQLFALHEQEQGVCFLNIGTAQVRKPFGPRAAPDSFVSSL